MKRTTKNIVKAVAMATLMIIVMVESVIITTLDIPILTIIIMTLLVNICIWSEIEYIKILLEGRNDEEA